MLRFLELFLFCVVATGIHIAGFYTIPAKGIQAGGAFSTEAVSINAASQAIETMVEHWDEQPSVNAQTDVQIQTKTYSDITPQISVPNIQTAPLPLPSMIASTAPKSDEPLDIQTESAKPKEIKKAKPRPEKKPLQKTKKKKEKTERKKVTSNGSQGQKAKGNATNTFAGSGKANVTTGMSQKQLASLQQVWGAKIRRSIERSKKYPRGARKNGKAVISLTVTRSGRLVSYSLMRSSGVKKLDTAALQAVNNTGRFPIAPKELKAKSYKFVLPIIFKR